jgi:hypothetical protein
MAGGSPRSSGYRPKISMGIGQVPREDRGAYRVEVGHAGETGVDRLEPLCCLQQQRGHIAAPACRKCEPGSHKLCVRMLRLTKQTSFRYGQQVQRRIELARLDLGLRPGQRSPCPLRRVGCQPAESRFSVSNGSGADFRREPRVAGCGTLRPALGKSCTDERRRCGAR